MPLVMWFKLLLLGLVWAPLLAQTQARDTSGQRQSATVLQPQLEALRTLRSQIAARQTELAGLERTVYRLQACANRGMGYAPNHSAAEAATGCVSLGPGRLVNDIQFTTASTTGNMTASGYTTAYDRLMKFINDNGCPNQQGWRVCTEDEILFGYSRLDTIADIDTLSGDAWVYGLDLARFNTQAVLTAPPGGVDFPPAHVFATEAVTFPTVSTNCTRWTSNSSTQFGTALTFNTTGRNGLGLRACNVSAKVACCR